VIASGVGLAGVAGYWFASILQCGINFARIQQVACPVVSWPIVDYLLLLTAGALLLAISAVFGDLPRIQSIGSAILVAVAFEFPITSVFTGLTVFPGIFDVRYLLAAMVSGAGLVGFVASWRFRRARGGSSVPCNVLALGAMVIALTGWAAYFLPWQFGSNGTALDCPLGGQCSVAMPPLIPDYSVALLIGVAVLLALPIYFPRLSVASLAAAILTLVMALDVAAATFRSQPANSALVISMLCVELGSLIGIIGLVSVTYKVYLAPRYGPFWFPPGARRGA
jgi:hypothetical protein